MKRTINFLFVVTSLSIVLNACNKLADLPTTTYANGNAPVLTSDATTITPAVADSDKIVLNLSWTNPKYATDSSTQKFLVEIDSSGRNFSKETTFTVIGSLNDSFSAKQLNSILLNFGFAYNTSYPVDIRVTSSYGNNNEQLQSNVITVNVTTYVVPPKVTPPSSNTLFLVGDATAGGWGNPVPLPAQQFTRVDSVDYQGIFYLNGGKQYLMLPVDGDWTHKYSVADNSVTNLSAGGDFGYDLSANFPGPAASGMYQISVDFQHGKFTVTPVTLYKELYVPGDYQGWTPASAPTLASPNNDGNYEGYINVPSGGSYEFKITDEPDWNGTAYGDGGNGTLSSSGGNLKFPGAGYYKVNVDLNANTYTITPASVWGVIGSFAGSGWGTDVDMTYNSGDNDWTATITIADGDQFKFRANHDWGLNYGDKNADGTLEVNGDNLAGYAAGTYNVTLYLDNAGYYTYKVVKQ
ncbi:MAG TPA: SusE domain-containing protein [Parafilimonas sp.]|nr:SusE domain-containing protein [Parafilimonas sp.]